MLKNAMQFYKTLFGNEPKENIKLGVEFWNDEEKISPEENEMLEASFSEDEIREVVYGSYAKGAPGPDGFSFLFYYRFWGTIKNDFMALIKGFEQGNINIARLNYALITLIPKEEEAKALKKFMPISLINYRFKFFAKDMNNMLISICDRLLANN
jgi:hypothetical protein